MDKFVPKFKPMKVAYSNTNTFIKEAAESADQLEEFKEATEELSQGQQIEWRASSYMEVDEAMGGGMQKSIVPDLELLETCRPIIKVTNSNCCLPLLHFPHAQFGAMHHVRIAIPFFQDSQHVFSAS